MSAVFSPFKKAWKKTVKPTAQINTDQERGKFKSVLWAHALSSVDTVHSKI